MITLTPPVLSAQLARLPDARRYLVAYSGGCDSHVLLHAMHQLQQRDGFELAAVHINHGLSPHAKEWELHCGVVCASLGIPCQSIPVQARAKAGESPEAAARKARYAALRSVVQQGEGLLLAHHMDDQAETLLLQQFRGAGSRGLAAMPAWQKFQQGWLGRPLLDISRAQLLDYARENQLSWIDDPSNFDTDFDRNFLRHDVVPILQQRWPSMNATLARVSRLQAETSQLLEELAELDWQHCQSEQDGLGLPVESLLSLSPHRQRNLLRYWISEIQGMSLPNSERLYQIQNEVLTAAEDASPCVSWQGVEVRRYRGTLFAMSPQAELEGEFTWADQTELVLPDGSVLQKEAAMGQGLKQELFNQGRVSVRFREGGESCRPAGRKETHQLKKLFQDWGIPPWERQRIPLLYLDDELAMIVGYCVCEPFAANREEQGVLISHKPAPGD